jgi:hypothetical protein
MLAEHIRHAIDTVPLWNWALQAVGLETAYVGAELNARQRIGGFHVWLASNVALGVPPRVTIVVASLEPRTLGAAMKEISSTLRTIIQRPGSSSAVAA